MERDDDEIIKEDLEVLEHDIDVLEQDLEIAHEKWGFNAYHDATCFCSHTEV